ncbi:MAG: pyridoxal phosphate-dependent class II aminotransferase [Mobilitalea sp.]
MHKHGGDIYQKEGLLDFSANINPAGIPEGIILGAVEGIRRSSHYPDARCSDLRKAIADKLNLPLEYIICGNGAADLIFSLILALKPKKALLPVPSFYEYEQALRTVDCELTYFPMKKEHNFQPGKEFLEEIKEDTEIIFLCNPNNPTGQLINHELLLKILLKCEQLGIWLIADECFLDFIDASADLTLMKQCREAKHLFILKAFTKLYAMPGLRLGYGISSNAALLNRMREVSQPWNVSVPAQLAGIAALKEDRYVAESLDLIKKERNYLSIELQKLDYIIYGSRANYIFFQTVPGLYEYCLRKGILIRDCSNYQGLTEGYYRIAVKNHEENEQLIRVLGEAKSEWQKQL